MQHGGCYILYGCTTRPCDELVRDNGEGNPSCSFFFFNDTATTEIYTLSLHDALPISLQHGEEPAVHRVQGGLERRTVRPSGERSEEHTSELQSQSNLVCRLLLEKKKEHGMRRPAGGVLAALSRRIDRSRHGAARDSQY